MADEETLRQYLKKATGELQHTARKLHDIELKESEPIAIVGIGCRFPPDLRSAADLWRFVAGEGDAISSFPDDRGWGSAGGLGADAAATPGGRGGQGGFLAGADRFDAEFFGIGEHEALAMDPQQRLLLETAWAAVEHAGLDPAGLRGTPTGIYAGVSYCHYGAGLTSTPPAGVDDQLIIGGTPSTTSGRVAYVMGWHGPAISIDTACSSSLVAIHLATQGLRRGDCDLALAGGVTVMATPQVIVEFGRRGALARDGRCKPFAAAADGMGFGEGAGLLVLERLSLAVANGHDVLAVIRGSAVNQDGATNGLTSPSRAAQEAVIRQALATARITPDQVDAVEGHGTGTALGDSIEAEAIIATYGEARSVDRPLRLGSVKSNIGHTQTASGVAGVIKMVMSMRAGKHSRTLHIDRPSAYVDWSGGTVVLTTQSVPWPQDGRPRRAGVSSFGISGTNAHLILEEAPTTPPASEPAPDGRAGATTPWVLSAKTEPALRTMALELTEFLAAVPSTLGDVGASLARTRAGFRHRAVTMAASVDEHLTALAALSRGGSAPGLITGVVATRPTAVMFTGGQTGAAESTRRLAQHFPPFAAAYDEVRMGLAAHLDQPLAAYPQAEVFARQLALWGLIRSFGVGPDLVAGSGIGEIAAAHAAGILSRADAEALAAAAARAADADDRQAAGELRATAERVAYALPHIRIVSTGEPGRADHWAGGGFLRGDAEDMRSRVRSHGSTTCLELDPGAILSPDDVLTRLAAAYTTGTAMSWQPAFTTSGARHIPLPSYPFQRKRYWLDAPIRHPAGNQATGKAVHPLLGCPIDLAESVERRFSADLTAHHPWYVAHYRINGGPALPPAAVADWALAAAHHAADDPLSTWTIENLTFDEPTAPPGPLSVQTAAETHGAARRIRGFTAQAKDLGHAWTPRFTAWATEPLQPPPPWTDVAQLRAKLTEQHPEALFARAGAGLITWGPAFRQVARPWWRADHEALALIESDLAAADRHQYLLHPVVLETCFLAARTLIADAGPLLPSYLSRLTRHREVPRRLWCHARRGQGDSIDVDLYSDAGEPLVTVVGLTFAAAELGRPPAVADPVAGAAWDADDLSRLAVEQPTAARAALTDILFARVAALVDGPVADPDGRRDAFAGGRLGDLGLDSLRAMRLREQLRSGLSVDVPPQRLLGDTTVADIVDLVCRSLAARRLVVTSRAEPPSTELVDEFIL